MNGINRTNLKWLLITVLGAAQTYTQALALGSDYLIAPGSQWRYYDKTSAPQARWQKNSVVSQHWPVGKAQLGCRSGCDQIYLKGTTLSGNFMSSRL